MFIIDVTHAEGRPDSVALANFGKNQIYCVISINNYVTVGAEIFLPPQIPGEIKISAYHQTVTI
jgi:hypothetical protein